MAITDRGRRVLNMRSLTAIEELFGSMAKPEQFGHPDHCCECAEHNETLLSHTPATISFKELGNPGWDPICYIDSIDAFKYYLPALTRLACIDGDEYYLDQFLFHLNRERIDRLAPQEREAVADFLEELTDRMPQVIEENLDSDAILDRIAWLRDWNHG